MFEKLIIDSDQPLLAAAAGVQQNYVTVTHKASGKEKEFPTLTEFYGHWKNKSGGWLAKQNEDREVKWTPEDFDYEEGARLHPEIEDHLESAEQSFDFFVGGLKKLGVAEDYELVIHNTGNFRNDVAQIKKYKGSRKDKPLIFEELKEFIVRKYKYKVKFISGIESDDYVSIKAWENYNNYRKTGVWKYCLSYCDKDLKQCIGPYINFLDKESGVQYITPAQAAFSYTSQLLTGDRVDNIPGLPNLTEAIREKYGLGKRKGIGPATAKDLLEGLTPKGMFERVVEAYKSYYSEPDTLENWKGEKVVYSWLDHLNERARLLYMLRDEVEANTYNITQTLDKLGVVWK